MLRVTQDGSDVLLPVKAVPGASRDRIVGELGGVLKVTVAAAPERGAANAAIAKLLAKALGVRAAAVQLESGPASPQKVFRIAGASVQQVLAGLGVTEG